MPSVNEKRRGFAMPAGAGTRTIMGQSSRGQAGVMLKTEVEEEGQAPSGEAGIRTFLVADLRGYTRFTTEHGDERAAETARLFENIARESVEDHGGSVFGTAGDQVLATFASARKAAAAALQLQSRLADLAGRGSPMLEAGVGLDAGEPMEEGGDFRGRAVNLAARLCSLAAGGEVLASDTVTNLAGKIEGVTVAGRGHAQLKGFQQPVAVMALVPETDRLALPCAPQVLPIGGFLGALPSGQMIDRETELQGLATMIDGVNAGTGRLVMLMGEPGVGKTRVAQEATIVLRDRGFLVAAGRCYEPAQSTPYFPFLEALEDLYRKCPPQLRDGVVQRWPYLANLLPEHDLPIAPRAEGVDERDRLSRTVSGFVTAIAAERPVAILVDDLHWADESSVHLVQHLVRHTRSSRVLLLGTYRDVEVQRSHPLSKALRDLHREQLVERMPIRRLPEAASADLIAATMDQAEVSREFAEQVYASTEGNPFFTVEVLRTLVERGDLYRQNGRWERRDLDEIAVPESVRDAIGERLSHLSEEAQAMLAEASVLGQTFSFEEVTGLSDRTERETEDLIQEAVSSGILREGPDEGYAFDHALTQQTLCTELSPRSRRRVHLSAAEVILALDHAGRRAAELAHHFLEAGDVERALRFSIGAGGQAEEVFAHGEAESHYRLALELLGDSGDATAEARVLEKLGRVLTNAGRLDDARGILERSMRRYGAANDEVGEIRAAVQLGMVHRSAGSMGEGITLIHNLVQRLEDQGRPGETTELYIVLERLFFAASRYEEALGAAERGAELARASGDQGALGRAEVGRGTELMHLGRTTEGVAVLEAAIPLAEAAGDNFNLLRALNNVAGGYMSQGNFIQARRFAEQNLALHERIQDPWGIVFASAVCGWICRQIGDWPQARIHFKRGGVLARSLSFSWYAQALFVKHAQFYLDEGRPDDARSLAKEVLATDPSGDLQSTREAQTLLAQLDLLEGRPENASGRLEPLLDRPGLAETDVTRMLPTLALAYLEGGDPDRAETTLDQAIHRARSEGAALFEAEALVVRGKLMSERGQWDEAERDLQEAIDMAGAMPFPHLKARALYQRGLMEIKSEDHSRARQTLQEARSIFDQLGALLYLRLTESALQVLESKGSVP
jgi:class 3 adenylate cyclase/tetratricopeptide (TPR) repeat protein